MKKSSGNGWLKVLCVVMIIVAVSILIMNIIVLFVCSGQPSTEVVIEANVISLIGLAITTWVGLNIAGYVDRRAVQNLKEKTEDLANRVIILQGEASDLSKQLAIANRQERQKLLDDLRLDRGIGISKWIYRQLLDMSDASYDVDIWSQFREEETLYHQLEQTFDPYEVETITNHIKNCIDAIREQARDLKESDKRILKEVLLLRETEILFTKAYRQKGPNQRECFVAVTQRYTQSGRSQIFQWPSIPESYEYKKDSTELMEIIGEISAPTCPIMAHIFNFIGDAYSELLWLDMRHPQSDERQRRLKASCFLSLNYCLLAVCASEKGKYRNECYYRNYGCAIERACYLHKKENVDKYVQSLDFAISQYYKALDCSAINSSVYHCLASAYNKIFEALTGIEKYAEDGEKNSQKDEIRRKLRKYMESYKRVKDLYVAIFPQEWKAHLMEALYFRDMYILCKKNKEKPANYARKLSQVVYQLELLRPSIKGTKIAMDRIAICKEAMVAIT